MSSSARVSKEKEKKNIYDIEALVFYLRLFMYTIGTYEKLFYNIEHDNVISNGEVEHS